MKEQKDYFVARYALIPQLAQPRPRCHVEFSGGPVYPILLITRRVSQRMTELLRLFRTDKGRLMKDNTSKKLLPRRN